MMTEKRKPACVFSPGSYLLDELNVRGISVDDFARDMGWKVKRLEDILLGRQQMNDGDAEQIGAALGTSAILWINLNKAYFGDVSPADTVSLVAARDSLRTANARLEA